MDKNKGGRPTKLTEKFKRVAEEVIYKNALSCTDEDLLFLINEKLEPEERISERTWKYWKSEALDDTVDTDLDEERRDWFLPLIKRALILERDNLMQNLKEDNKAWQRWAWIIERKFKEWRMVNEFSGKLKHEGKVDGDFNHRVDLSKLSDEEVEAFTKLANKTTTE